MKFAGHTKEWPFLLTVIACLFCVYGLTTPMAVTLEDDGLFILASLDAGVAHPPGFPLFTFLGHLFSYLPLTSPALRIHLLSGLLGALACGVLYLVARELGLSRLSSLTAVLAYGLSEHFWSQLKVEVTTLG